MFFSFINIRKVSPEVLKASGFALGRQRVNVFLYLSVKKPMGSYCSILTYHLL